MYHTDRAGDFPDILEGGKPYFQQEFPNSFMHIFNDKRLGEDGHQPGYPTNPQDIQPAPKLKYFGDRRHRKKQHKGKKKLKYFGQPPVDFEALGDRARPIE